MQIIKKVQLFLLNLNLKFSECNKFFAPRHEWLGFGGVIETLIWN